MGERDKGKIYIDLFFFLSFFFQKNGFYTLSKYLSLKLHDPNSNPNFTRHENTVLMSNPIQSTFSPQVPPEI